MSWPWDALGLDGPSGLREIRRAYAEKLKTVRPEEKPEEFLRLHNAYQSASRYARELRREESAKSVEFTAYAQAVPIPPEEPPPAREEIPAEWEEIPEQGEAPRARWIKIPTAWEEMPAKVRAPKSKDWDFTRLFAEGEAERRGKQFQKALKLRRANAWRDSAWARPAAALEAGRLWLAVSAALSLLELLDSSASAPPAWRNFLGTDLFADVRNNPDFVYGLEDFLRERPKFSREVRWALFQAYGFQQGRIPWEYRPLYRLLGGWEFRDAPRIAVVCLFTPVILTLFMLLFPRFSWQDQLCGWMEEDFGIAFEALDRGPGRFFTLRGRFRPANSDAPNSDPANNGGENRLVFWAALSGRRDPKYGAHGYRTNYTTLLLSRELAAFAAGQGWTITPEGMDRPVRRAKEAPAFYLDLPLTGAGEGITALGGLLAALSETDWYRELPPEYQLYLCYGNWCFDHTVSTENAFNARTARRYYETELIPALRRMAEAEDAAQGVKPRKA